MAENIQSNSQIVSLNVLASPPRSLFKDAWSRLSRNKGAVVSMVIIAIFFIVALFADKIVPHNPLEISLDDKFLPPVWVERGPTGAAGDPSYIFGTDTLGRDILSRTIYGARVSMIVGLVPTTIILFIGTIVGLYSGYAGGRMDNVLMRLTDVIYAFPDILFFIIVMISLRNTVLGQMLNGLLLLFSALAFVSWVGVARIVRGQVLSLKEKEYVEAARAIGAKDSRIMFRHLLPNSLGPVIIIAATTIPGMIITEAILGYLGLGLRPSTNQADFFLTSWGALLLDGQTAINAQPWALLTPAISVAIIVLAFTFLGDGLRDAFDPRLQGTQ